MKVLIFERFVWLWVTLEEKSSLTTLIDLHSSSFKPSIHYNREEELGGFRFGFWFLVFGFGFDSGGRVCGRG